MAFEIDMKNLSKEQCPVDTLLKLVCSSKCNDCGKCVFGYEGASQLIMTLKDITEKKGKSGDLEQISELCGMMKTQSLCEDGEELAAVVSGALDDYRAEFEAHISKKGCTAGVCKRFVTFHILADQCIGCGECLDACDEGAIKGKKKFIHVIEQDECTQCGECLDACDEDAIVKAGAVKPRCPKKPIPCKKH